MSILSKIDAAIDQVVNMPSSIDADLLLAKLLEIREAAQQGEKSTGMTEEQFREFIRDYLKSVLVKTC